MCVEQQQEQAATAAKGLLNMLVRVLSIDLTVASRLSRGQFNDLDSALVASVDDMEQSDLSSLAAASRDSELVGLQVKLG